MAGIVSSACDIDATGFEGRAGGTGGIGWEFVTEVGADAAGDGTEGDTDAVGLGTFADPPSGSESFGTLGRLDSRRSVEAPDGGVDGPAA